MEDKERKVPKLRFPGFTDDWEQRKLGEIADINPTAKIPNEFYYVDLESVVGVNLLAMTYQRREDAPSRAQRVAQKKDIFYQTVRPYQKNNFLFDLVGNYVFSTGYAQLRAQVDPDYLFSLIQTNQFVKKVLDKCTGTSYPAINSTDLRNIKIYVSIDRYEQKLIGDFFSRIDSLTTLYQRKLDDTKKLKNALLQKLFPKEGTNVPELRFPGFTDAWEQRKLGEILTVNSGRDYKHLSKGKIPVYGTGGYMLSVAEALSNSKDAIGIGRKGTINSPFILRAPFWTVDTLFYCIPNEDLDFEFLYCVFELINWEKYNESTGVPSLSKKSIEEIGIRYPVSQEEREKIGLMIAKLRVQLTLHQRKLDNMKKLKQSLLQQMFV